MSQSPFKKFIDKKSNAAIKERHKQEKKAAKKERAAAIERRFEEKRALRKQERSGGPAGKSRGGTRPSAMVAGQAVPESMPLNKYLAHCGIASRREAATIIREGGVSVNQQPVTEPGHKVSEQDDVRYRGKKVLITKDLVYILLNKPKDYITTTDDPQHRKTVLQLIKGAGEQRIYPVGRLDRNTSGVLLLTNDGQLTQELTHPSFLVKKVYEVKLDRPLSRQDFERILAGVQLEDGEIHADALAYADDGDKSVIGIELHSGRNRIVRRMFEHLGYDVRGLDRVMYANLTKKNVERGKWRYLSEKEIRLLKYLNKKQPRVKTP